MKQLEPVFTNDTDQKIYEYICTNKFITTQEALKITKLVSKQGASLALNRLMQMGLVTRERKGREFIYRLAN